MPPTPANDPVTTASPTASMVCHLAWLKYDIRNYPPWPADVDIGFTCSILAIFVLHLRICALMAKARLLKRRKDVLKEELEGIRIEMVEVAMAPRRAEDSRPRA
ncbi:hypothetical protein BDZ45DRAFT_752414 [Acephala macrosclerotiorum]|nr:hypothetical protein BDZ45DRAFT_752414 [Acephala macrosclerotiorum]